MPGSSSLITGSQRQITGQNLLEKEEEEEERSVVVVNMASLTFSSASMYSGDSFGVRNELTLK